MVVQGTLPGCLVWAARHTMCRQAAMAVVVGMVECLRSDLPAAAAAAAAAAAVQPVLLTRQVSLEEGDAKARDLSVNFIETSAKAGFNIKVGFQLRQGRPSGSSQLLLLLPARGAVAYALWKAAVSGTSVK